MGVAPKLRFQPLRCQPALFSSGLPLLVELCGTFHYRTTLILLLAAAVITGLATFGNLPIKVA